MLSGCVHAVGSLYVITAPCSLHQDETAVHLSAMLRLNQTLRELHLGKMAFTDSGMERLAEGLRANHSLRYLDLRWCGLTPGLNPCDKVQYYV